MPEGDNKRPGNIAAHLGAMAQKQPERAAVICATGRDKQGEMLYEQMSFLELEATSNRLAAALLAAGLRRGTRTALMVPPGLDFFVLTFALFKLGAVPVLIDPGIGLGNLRGCLAHAEPEAFIGISKAHAARVLLGWARNSVSIVITVGRRWFWGGQTLRGILDQVRQDQGFVPIQPEPGETAAILFTSGSTGAPKGAVYTHEMFGAQVEHIRQLYGIEPGEVDLATFPLFALFGPALGMTAVIPKMDASRPAKVDPKNIFDPIRRFGITNMFGSPALINRVGRHGEKFKLQLPTLRRVISAGAPVPARTLERFAGMLSPGIQIFTPYGATECLPVASIGSNEILHETRKSTDEGAGVCIGRPLSGLTARVIGISDQVIDTWDEALTLSVGEIGEIAVKAAHASRSYFNLPDATAMAKIQAPGGGFYHRMGDVGYYDAAGRLWFCGRKAHRVVTASQTLFSIPCEGVFNAHPQVYRTALVGVERNGTIEPVICVEMEPGVGIDSQSSVTRELRELGLKYPHTRDIQLFLFHPGFPVDVRHNAKIFREKLAVWAAEKLR